MTARRLLAAFTVLALAAAPASYAAKAKPKPKPKPVCNLLTDETGDGSWDLAPPVSTKTLDIVGGDLATGSKQMVAVLRLGSTDFASDPYSHLGYNYSFAATSTLGQVYSFTAIYGLTGLFTWAATVDGKTVNGVKFSAANNMLTWTIDRSASPNLARPKNVFHIFRAQSQVESSSADSALNTTNTYADRALSCVHAG